MMKPAYLFVAVIAGLLVGCGEKDPVLSDIRSQGKLIILTRNAPTTYYLDVDDNPAGFEYDLSLALARSLHVEAEYRIYDNIEDIIEAIANGEGHIAAAGLTRTDSREQNHVFGPSYKTVQQQVVCHRHAASPAAIDELQHYSLLVIAESSYQESLRRLRQRYPDLNWETTNELSTEQVLAKVVDQEVDCTVADSNIVALNQRYFPDLKVALSISKPQQLAWLLSPQASHFKHYISEWFGRMANASTLASIDERYYGYVDSFDYYDNSVFLRRLDTRLPNYRSAFQQVAEQYRLPWTLLAAQAYQESGWNPAAKSPTGVRGLMMLTRNTARAMGIKKRTDPLQSIKGGAKYLNRMLNRIPAAVAAEDRLWFALAAYNIGHAHLMDARKLAKKLGKNPNQWHDLKTVLPLLTQKRYYKTLKHGYARGFEPVRYIDRIRYYRDVLVNALT
ncbi:membrane-bound lytic murein transglycosylase MltF [Methylomarinum sp. Ch1-1]|uniref:Membrane-bound lytic murein transglycosylase F n=1 Tax=Methylomarinum roseum TaxID=3067653 RepID=A0AAU7NTV0_9GAMM|nr:membrane-bound lytic murein transglycosylase MltF [Methylomarinum sp. Ch1-1]MDP4519508.1 membrane-bound lytic murein transglycosylase MltF [Methylomarinum sp. Ch1-1]